MEASSPMLRLIRAARNRVHQNPSIGAMTSQVWIASGDVGAGQGGE